jgi:hypothetical protein
MEDFTTTTTTNPDDGRRASRRRKGIFGLVAGGLAALLMVGAGFAYFSDSITGSTSGTAGTLDISGTMNTTRTDGLTTDSFVTDNVTQSGNTSTVANVNPGDVIKLDPTATNAGTKSAWMRTELTGGTADSSIAPYLYVYSGGSVPTQADLLAASAGANPASALQSLPGYAGTVTSLSTSATTPQIVSGSVEQDGASTSYSDTVEIYFDSNAPDAAQNANFSLNAAMQAIQYRNNTAVPGDAQWNTVESGTISSGTWSSN